MLLIAIVFWIIFGLAALGFFIVIIKIIKEFLKGKSGNSGYPYPLNKYLH